MRRAALLLAVCALLCVAATAQEKGSPATGYAPLYVSLVKWASLKQLEANRVPPARTTGRAAGFPPVPQFSRRPIPRGASSANASRSAVALGAVAATNINTIPKPVTSVAGGDVFVVGGAVASPLRATNGRRLHQAAVFNTSSAAARTMRTGFDAAATDASGTQGLAVGPSHMLHGAGSVLSVYTLDSSTGSPSGSPQQVLLSELFATVAEGCTGGVYDPDVIYDQHAKRFYVSATCGGDGRALLAVTSSSNPTTTWFAFSLVADAVNTRLACTSPVEAAMVDYTRLTYNRDAVFVSLYSYCPSATANQGSMILALPKSSVVKGQPNFFYAVYTSAEVADAVAAANGPRFSSNACRQMQPVVPQQLEDVRTGSALFLCEVPPMGSPQRGLVAVALADTPSLWGYTGPDGVATAPLLTARYLAMPDTPAATGPTQGQPQNAPWLPAAGYSARFWSGNAVQSGSKVFFALSGSNAGRPSALVGQLAVRVTAARTSTCPTSTMGTTTGRTFAWSSNYTSNWGAEWDPNWRNQPKAMKPAALMQAASVGSNIWQPNAGGMRTAGMGDGCSCYQCYWGGSYYLFGGYQGGNVQQPGFGYAGFGSNAGYYSYGFQNNGWSYGFGDNSCYVQCMRCYYYGYPGNGMGYTGAYGLVTTGSQFAFTADIGVNGSSKVNTSGTTSSTAADFQRLLRPCNRAASMVVNLDQTMTVGGSSWGAGLDLGQPVVAATANGTLLVAYTYSGVAGGVPGNKLGDYYAGFGASVMPATIAAGAARPAAVPLAVRAGAGLVPNAARWGDNSAAAVAPSTGRVYTAVKYAAAPGVNGGVGVWIAMWAPGQLNRLTA